MVIPTLAAVRPSANRVCDPELNRKTTQQTTPINIIERPIVLRISTRNKSLHGAQPQAIRNSCSRNRRPSPKISAPRRIVVRAIWPAGRPFCRKLVGHHREGDSREKKKQRRRQSSAKL